MKGLLFLALATIFLWLAISITLKGGAKKPMDAVAHIGAFCTGVILILALIIFVVPSLVEYMTEQALPQYWQPVLNGAWDDTQQAGSTVADIINQRSIPSQPISVTEPSTAPAPQAQSTEAEQPAEQPAAQPAEQAAGQPQIVQPEIKYTIKAGDTLKQIADQHHVAVDDIVSKNSIANPNLVSVGTVLVIQEQVLIVPTAAPELQQPEAKTKAKATAIPMPTPTPAIDWSSDFNAIDTAKTQGNIQTGVEVINKILRTEPNNTVAIGYQHEIQMANELKAQWGGLSMSIVDGSSLAEVTSALSGFTFQVQTVEDGFNFKLKGEEEMTLTCVSDGWLKGQTITISRRVGEQLGFKAVGNNRTVGG
jgi:LysM repeat protein